MTRRYCEVRVKIGNAVLELVEGDITEQSTEAIVNAANRTLLSGGGVDGSIHRAGGPRILDECRKLNGCDPGDAKVTTGGNLPSPYIIHTVGPVYRDGKHHEADLLASAYKRSLEVAVENGIKSISSPSISTGAYGYPIDQAAKVAMQAVMDFLKKNDSLEEVIFVLFNDMTYKSYEDALGSFQF